MNCRDRWTTSRLSCVLVAAGVLVGAGLARGMASEPSKAEARATLSGRVLDKEGRPVAGARVRLHQWNSETGRFPAARAESTSDESGSYHFKELPEGHYELAVLASGFAPSFRGTPLETGGELALDVVLGKPVSPVIELRDEQDRPVVGAELRGLRQRGQNGEFVLRRIDWDTFGVTVDPSDAQGRLRLPPQPEGTILTATIDHHQQAPVRVADVRAAEGTIARATMPPGVPLTLRIQPDEAGATVSDLSVRMFHRNNDSASNISLHRIEVGRDGTATFAIEAGEYELLWLEHEEFFVTPVFIAGLANGREHLRIESGQNDQLSFRLHRKVPVRGRIIDASTGRPLAGADVRGEIANHPREAALVGSDWSHVGWGETDENGEYTLSLAAGRARVSFEGDEYIAARDTLERNVAADGSTIVPDFEVRRIPAITGTVLDPSGEPVAGAVVRFRGRWLAIIQPVVTDEHGRFELQTHRIPVDPETGARLPEQPIVAFHPHEPLSAAVRLRLDDAEAVSNVRLTLEKRDYESVLSDFANEMPGWQSGDTSGVPDAAERLARSLNGRPAPELDGAGWINTERSQMSLGDFRGRYVLLDFWFIGCGPCHYDFPSVKLVHELYNDHGVTVIGVHNNSATPEAVRAHVDKEGLRFPIVVDHPDGRIVSSYEAHKVRGYPSYILIGPDGKVIHHDDTVPAPSLRTNKLEIIRRYAMDSQ